jgi:hypothetical protein
MCLPLENYIFYNNLLNSLLMDSDGFSARRFVAMDSEVVATNPSRDYSAQVLIRLGSTCGDGLRGDGGNGLGPGNGGRLRLDDSGQLGGCELGCGSDHLRCDGSDRLGCNGSDRLECNGSNQLGWGSDDQIGCDGLNWAGDGLKDGGRPVGHRSRLDDRASDGGWTKVDREAGKGVGSRAVQGDEKGSALLARIVFDKDNPLNWSNTLHSVVMRRE